MKNNILKYSECSNCGACYSVCPAKAITVSDDLFYGLLVDESQCIDCGKCVSVCPVNNSQERQNLLQAFAGSYFDADVVKKSSSGGAFYVIANYILSCGGVVFAAAFDKNCKKVVIKSTDEVSLEDLLRSKYVESLVGDSFIKIKAQLDERRKVLFCGCPCQVAGLLRYLSKDYENLLTCDFSCGGLPSHQMYGAYLTEIEAKYKSPIKHVNFRPKTYGWDTYSIEIKCENGKKYKNIFLKDPYFAAFIGKHYSVRDNCLTCKFADNHYADIILADFWKYKTLSTLKPGDGLSLVLVNSRKGKIAFEAIKDKFNGIDLDLGSASYNIRKIEFPQAFLDKREAFIEFYKKFGLNKAAEKYVFESKTQIAKKVLKIRVKKIIRLLKKRRENT